MRKGLRLQLEAAIKAEDYAKAANVKRELSELDAQDPIVQVQRSAARGPWAVGRWPWRWAAGRRNAWWLGLALGPGPAQLPSATASAAGGGLLGCDRFLGGWSAQLQQAGVRATCAVWRRHTALAAARATSS